MFRTRLPWPWTFLQNRFGQDRDLVRGRDLLQTLYLDAEDSAASYMDKFLEAYRLVDPLCPTDLTAPYPVAVPLCLD